MAAQSGEPRSRDSGPEEDGVTGGRGESVVEPSPGAPALSAAARKWQIRVVYFIGFMVS